MEEDQQINLADRPVDRDPEEDARAAGLEYVSDQEPGYHRKRWGRGFTYIGPDGKRVADARLRERFEKMAIPPAWEEVWICRNPKGHIQATGRDTRGRKQYIYHSLWERYRSNAKFDRLAAFGEALPDIRRQVNRDLARRSLSQEKILAIVVQLLDETLIRIGNPEYARRNQSYGLTTLRPEHLDVNGSHLVFKFPGKGSKDQHLGLHDRRLARMIRRMEELPGQRLFQYLDENGECCRPVLSEDVNDYLRSIGGQSFTAKDFRTWGATVLAARELDRAGPPADEAEASAAVSQAVEMTADALGNTPAVTRAYYIHPEILRAYEDGRLFDAMQRARQTEPDRESFLSPEESAVIEIMAEKARERRNGSGR